VQIRYFKDIGAHDLLPLALLVFAKTWRAHHSSELSNNYFMVGSRRSRAGIKQKAHFVNLGADEYITDQWPQ
jgi:hypothetical protein